MPVTTAVVGNTGKATTTHVDARWTMSYAAGLGDMHACYMDTTQEEGVIAHPLFPVCVEWQVRGDGPGFPGLRADEGVRGVHYSHHLTLHRPVRAGDDVTTKATVVAVERHRAGAFTLTRYDATDASGQKLWTTYTGGLMRDVGVEGEDRRIDGPDDVPRAEGASDEQSIDVRAEEAHVYTECARIWNPIHTDLAVAKGAGLPDIILHGTATLALAVSRICGDRPQAVRTVAGRFGAMVLMPSTLTLRTRPEGGRVLFEVSTQDGAPAVRNGMVEFRND